MEQQEESKSGDVEEMHAHVRQHMLKISGGADIRGAEIGNAIRMLANLYAHALNQTDSAELSGPRWGVLMRLLAAEETGNHEGINPTRLSHFQHVKKNTVTSLLRGLEEQGLVERTYDPQDRRKVRIRITPAGKDLVNSIAPARLEFMNQLSRGLTSRELDDLLIMLEKLRLSVMSHACEHAGRNPIEPDLE